MHVTGWWSHVMRTATNDLADECERERDPRRHAKLELALDCRSGHFLLVERKIMKNYPLLFETAEYILDHPTRWNQGIWTDECGTSCCFAGRACNLIGCRPVLSNDPIAARIVAYCGLLTSRELVTVPEWLHREMPVPFWTRDPLIQDSPIVHIRDAATAALRITEGEAEQLFHQDNEIGDIISFVTSAADDEHVELPLALAHFEMSSR